mmetsp:Transcript_14169/g.28397  ORF Transcript_14169/g.28397 Transcript_14169/m.28397 type:complete len:162 (-) Transcript_14169:1823-2308(-)
MRASGPPFRLSLPAPHFRPSLPLASFLKRGGGSTEEARGFLPLSYNLKEGGEREAATQKEVAEPSSGPKKKKERRRKKESWTNAAWNEKVSVCLSFRCVRASVCGTLRSLCAMQLLLVVRCFRAFTEPKRRGGMDQSSHASRHACTERRGAKRREKNRPHL